MNIAEEDHRVRAAQEYHDSDLNPLIDIAFEKARIFSGEKTEELVANLLLKNIMRLHRNSGIQSLSQEGNHILTRRKETDFQI